MARTDIRTGQTARGQTRRHGSNRHRSGVRPDDRSRTDTARCQTQRQVSNRHGSGIVAEIEAGGYDLVVLGSCGRGRLTTELFGSANGYVHFHSRIPLLSISGDESNSDAVEETALTGSAAH